VNDILNICTKNKLRYVFRKFKISIFVPQEGQSLILLLVLDFEADC